MINGINGSQPIQPKDTAKTNDVKQQVQEYKNSIFEKCDVDKNGRLEGKEETNFNALVKNFVDKIMNKQDDVSAATNQPSVDTVQSNFNADGTLQSDVVENKDGTKDIKAGNETIHVEKDGNSFSVKDDSGKNVSIAKTPDGGFEFKDESGQVHKFDKDMNPMS